jgi:hypothetical protein
MAPESRSGDSGHVVGPAPNLTRTFCGEDTDGATWTAANHCDRSQLPHGRILLAFGLSQAPSSRLVAFLGLSHERFRKRDILSCEREE